MTEHKPGPAERAGYPIDLPPGEHPYDWFIEVLAKTLGHRKAAIYLGVEVDREAPPTDWRGQPLRRSR